MMILPRSRRSLIILLLWLFLWFIFFIDYSHSSRTTNVFHFKPRSETYKGHYLNFLPRHFPIPTSGPSRRHNDVGLQSWKSP
ncbi:hypothetical protein K2173_000870 [Erythroxylum novogranatense]|uniref:Uncharacterized protein n=1 Tax=Erythroxylum novogranatense TaxID=1862640 RepID=A0AAV8TT38_9ROSI|nr:hypothetical protein K2173_000870 [Erythroxylum novogranatense]